MMRQLTSAHAVDWFPLLGPANHVALGPDLVDGLRGGEVEGVGLVGGVDKMVTLLAVVPYVFSFDTRARLF